MVAIAARHRPGLASSIDHPYHRQKQHALAVDALVEVLDPCPTPGGHGDSNSDADSRRLASQLAALSALVPASCEGDAAALRALVQGSQHWHAELRLAGLAGLQCVVRGGHRKAVAARLTGVRTLLEALQSGGNDDLLSLPRAPKSSLSAAAAASLSSSSPLSSVASCSEATILQTLAAALSDAHGVVQEAALEALLQLAREEGLVSRRIFAFNALSKLVCQEVSRPRPRPPPAAALSTFAAAAAAVSAAGSTSAWSPRQLWWCLQCFIEGTKDWHVEVRSVATAAVAAVVQQIFEGDLPHEMMAPTATAICSLAPLARQGLPSALGTLVAVATAAARTNVVSRAVEGSSATTAATTATAATAATTATAAAAAASAETRPAASCNELSGSPRDLRREALRSCAVDALSHVIMDSDTVVPDFVAARIASISALAKAALCSALAGSYEASQRALDVVLKCLLDWHAAMRAAAVTAVAEVAEETARILERWDEEDSLAASSLLVLHRSSVSALTRLAQGGSYEALKSLTSLCRQPQAWSM